MSAGTFTEIRRLRETTKGTFRNNTSSTRLERLKMRTIFETMDMAMEQHNDSDYMDDWLREKICYFNIPYCPFLTITEVQHVCSSDLEIKSVSVWYHRLSEVIESINLLLDEYSKGNFQTVAEIFTQGLYQALSVRLVKLRNLHCDFKDYEKIRKSTVLALQGLYQSVMQYANYNNLNTMYDACKERSDRLTSILTDPKKLREYIDNLNKKHSLILPSAEVTVVAAKIKPEYLEYIKLYGYPAGGIFDMDKLGEIIERLKNPLPPKYESSSDEECSVKECEPSVKECSDDEECSVKKCSDDDCSDDDELSKKTKCSDDVDYYNITKCDACS